MKDKVLPFLLGMLAGTLITFFCNVMDRAEERSQWHEVLKRNGIGIPGKPDEGRGP